MQLKDYDELLSKHDWYFQFSDDHQVYCRGRDEREDISKISKLSDQHAKLFSIWHLYYFCGDLYGTPQIAREEFESQRQEVIGS